MTRDEFFDKVTKDPFGNERRRAAWLQLLTKNFLKKHPLDDYDIGICEDEYFCQGGCFDCDTDLV